MSWLSAGGRKKTADATLSPNTARRKPGGGLIRVLRVRRWLTAAPQQGDHVETLLFTFPAVDADSATLQLRWGTTVVPVRVKAVRE
jgi:hypothetical protein